MFQSNRSNQPDVAKRLEFQQYNENIDWTEYDTGANPGPETIHQPSKSAQKCFKKILTGNGNDQFLQRMGVGQDKCLSEQQVINLLNNYFSDVPPENNGISQSTSPSKYHIDESMLTKEQRRYLKKQKK